MTGLSSFHSSDKEKIRWWSKRYFNGRTPLLKKYIAITAPNGEESNLFIKDLSQPVNERYPFKTEEQQNLSDTVRRICSRHLSDSLLRIRQITFGMTNCDDANLLLQSELYLLDKLVSLMLSTLVVEANLFRIRTQLTADPSSEDNFKKFCSNTFLNEFDINEFWGKYPVLYQLVITTLNNTSTFICQVLVHVSSDRSELEKNFGIKRNETLKSIKWGEGDTHRNGGVVAILSFSDSKLVYKPHSMKSDLAYNEFLRWLSNKKDSINLMSYTVLDKGEYGYCEFIKQEKCSNTNQLNSFYFKIGGLIAISWLLGITDLHYENLIASGDEPYLVDLETMFDAMPCYLKAHSTLQTIHFYSFSNLLFRTGLLPIRQMGENGIYDVSAIGADRNQPTPQKVFNLENLGRDDLRLVYKKGSFAPAQNIPTDGSKETRPATFVNNIIEGFDLTIKIFNDNKDELKSPTGPLSRFRLAPVRWVARATMDYTKILRDMSHPSVLKDVTECDMLIGGRLFSSFDSTPYFSTLARSEAKSLWNCDVPYFWTTPECKDLYDDNGRVFQGFFKKSGWDLLNKRLNYIDEHSNSQIEAIRLSLASTMEANPHKTMRSYNTIDNQKKEAIRDIKDTFINLACEIGHQLVRSAHYVDNYPVWIGLSPLNDSNYTAGLPAPTIYDGAAGIGLFLGNLFRTTGDKAFESITADIHLMLQRVIKESRKKEWPCGAFGGYSSLLYADLCLSDILGRSPTCLLPQTTQKLIKYIKEDINFDIISGAAGSLIVALRCYELLNTQNMMDAASIAAEHLIKNAKEINGMCTWDTMESFKYPKKLGGMAHGVSGIAWALSEWHAVTAENKSSQIVKKAMAYEQSLFDDQVNTWRDARYGTHTCYWCYGATGIGLAANKMRSVLGNKTCDSIIQTAKVATWNNGLSSGHSLCHGNLGNAELFISSGDNAKAITIATYVANRYINGYGWECDLPQGVTTPGLMCGLAGIGYGLLRNAHPELLPSILTLDKPISI